MAARKPFFSRKQLNWLIIVLVAVIALLSLTDPGERWPQLQRQQLNGVDVVWPLNSPHQPAMARLVLALPPHLSADSPLTVALTELLEEQLTVPPIDGLIQLHRLPDRVRLTLTLDNKQSLPTLLQRLRERPSPERLQRAQRRLTAALRLVSSSGNAALWPPLPEITLTGAITTPPLALIYDNWLSRAQLRIALNRSLDQDLRDQLQGLEALASGTPWSAALPPLPAEQTIQRATSSYQTALLTELPGRQADDYDDQLLALLWLQPIAEASGLRMDWQPRAAGSRIGLFDQRAQPVTADNLLADLQRRVEQRGPVDEKWLQRLERRLRNRLGQPLTYLDLLETIVSYQLPLDSLTRFAATIAAADGQQIQARAVALLDRSAYHVQQVIPLTQEP